MAVEDATFAGFDVHRDDPERLLRPTQRGKLQANDTAAAIGAFIGEGNYELANSAKNGGGVAAP